MNMSAFEGAILERNQREIRFSPMDQSARKLFTRPLEYTGQGGYAKIETAFGTKTA